MQAINVLRRLPSVQHNSHHRKKKDNNNIIISCIVIIIIISSSSHHCYSTTDLPPILIICCIYFGLLRSFSRQQSCDILPTIKYYVKSHRLDISSSTTVSSKEEECTIVEIVMYCGDNINSYSYQQLCWVASKVCE